MCHCSKKRFRHFLTQLPPSELEDILENDPFPVRLTCHNCSSEYTLSRAEIERIYHSSFLRVSRN
jgi:molecular chaperone Hsp33